LSPFFEFTKLSQRDSNKPHSGKPYGFTPN
jgi:hypothetical protein